MRHSASLKSSTSRKPSRATNNISQTPPPSSASTATHSPNASPRIRARTRHKKAQTITDCGRRENQLRQEYFVVRSCSSTVLDTTYVILVIDRVWRLVVSSRLLDNLWTSLHSTGRKRSNAIPHKALDRISTIRFGSTLVFKAVPTNLGPLSPRFIR